jgi:hypothetical protein
MFTITFVPFGTINTPSLNQWKKLKKYFYYH